MKNNVINIIKAVLCVLLAFTLVTGSVAILARPLTVWAEETENDGEAAESADEANESADEATEDGEAVIPSVPAIPQGGDIVIEPLATEEPEKMPRGPLSGVKIGIDPGHQDHANYDQEPVFPGSKETKAKVASGTQGVATRIPEYETNLTISLLLREALEAAGAEVYMTRETNDVDISNVERAEMMNELGVAVVLRLHCNGSDNRDTRGIGLYVKSSGEGAEESRAISDILIVAMGEATGTRTESIHVRDNYSGLNWSTVPSILVEMGYMSNPDEDKALNDPDYQAKLVEGMVQGMINSLGNPDYEEELIDEPEGDDEPAERLPIPAGVFVRREGLNTEQ